MEAQFLACHEEWMRVQAADLDELLQVTSHPNGLGARTDAELRELIAKNMRHYEDYSTRRRALARADGPAFFSPSWCSSFETSVLWLGGCRPSMFIRLLYSLSSAGLEAHLTGEVSLAAAAASAGGLVGLSSSQLAGVNELHQATLRKEERITTRMAALQERVADGPLLPIVRERRWSGSARGENGDAADAEVEAAMEDYAGAVAALVGEADSLRVETVRALLEGILTPRQAVEMLANAKQLHFAVHDWGEQRDLRHGRGG